LRARRPSLRLRRTLTLPRSKKSSSLAHLVPGQPPCKVRRSDARVDGCSPPFQVVRNGFYLPGETADLRAKCLDGDWDGATSLMTARLVDKFEATSDYAVWWTNETIQRYQRDGTPLPPARRSKAVAAAAEDDSVERAPAAKKSKKRASPDPPTFDSFFEMVRRANGDLTIVDGVVTISINGHEVTRGGVEDVSAMYDKVLSVTNVSAAAASLHAKCVSAGKALASFLDTNSEALDIMSVSRTQFAVASDPATALHITCLEESLRSKEELCASLVECLRSFENLPAADAEEPVVDAEC